MELSGYVRSGVVVCAAEFEFEFLVAVPEEFDFDLDWLVKFEGKFPLLG